ncbi:hypothetical protein E2C01_098284 [Portunus trituberculatus]|uniref:Uncharacterized protein n=1 Tax=Portunus trituberculatus TaxID=210409 RepID=A0A5B7KBR0_PORTR|nr:hypothetical protein [Portunus trituberculatus]
MTCHHHSSPRCFIGEPRRVNALRCGQLGNIKKRGDTNEEMKEKKRTTIEHKNNPILDTALITPPGLRTNDPCDNRGHPRGHGDTGDT